MAEGAFVRLRWQRLVLLAFLLFALTSSPTVAAPGEPADLAEARRLLVEQVVAHARDAAPLTGRPALDPAVMEALGALPRHLFVTSEAVPFAYFDIPLPAEHGLRESQPFIVALMTDLAAIGPADDVLILGVGGGYHMALASRLAGRVHAVDLDPAAVDSVAARLDGMGMGEVALRAADPYDGWPEIERRFDAIIVRLAVDNLPPMLLRQLAPGGRLVAPVGHDDDGQILTLVTRAADDAADDVNAAETASGEAFSAAAILPVRFMRLPGGERI